MKTALTIAGSDSCGGAGIQADIKTMTVNGVYAMSAVTALTAQNTTGVTSIMEATPEFLGDQLDAIFTDIFPDAVKIGMVSSKELIRVIAEKLKQYGAEQIVLDPVMVATSGAKLISDDAVEALKSELIPLASVITPNIPEAEVLSGMKITSPEAMEAAAEKIWREFGCAVTPMITCTAMKAGPGSMESGSIIRIPTEPAALCRVPLLPIWRRACAFPRPWTGRRRICRVLLQPCWTSVKEAAL